MENEKIVEFMKALFKALEETVIEEIKKTNEKLDGIAEAIKKHKE